MGFLGDLFDDVVDIASSPVRLGARVVDKVIDSDIEDDVKDLTSSIKVNSRR